MCSITMWALSYVKIYRCPKASAPAYSHAMASQSFWACVHNWCARICLYQWRNIFLRICINIFLNFASVLIIMNCCCSCNLLVIKCQYIGDVELTVQEPINNVWRCVTKKSIIRYVRAGNRFEFVNNVTRVVWKAKVVKRS